MFDLYGQNVNLFINRKPKFYTTLGGLVSICVILLIAYIFYGFILSWLKYEKMTIIPSLISNSVNELLAKNQTFEYNFNYQNYYIYWIISAVLPDGTILRTSHLKNYFNYSISYMSKEYVSEELLTEPCENSYIDTFLGLDEQTAFLDLAFLLCFLCALFLDHLDFAAAGTIPPKGDPKETQQAKFPKKVPKEKHPSANSEFSCPSSSQPNSPEHFVQVQK